MGLIKKSIIVCMVFAGLFSSIQIAKASILPKLRTEDVSSIQLNRISGESRLFKENDGYDEVTISKVIKWINTSNRTEGQTELDVNISPISRLEIIMKNGNIAVIEPAYNCILENQTRSCTIADGEVLLTQNNTEVRLKSLELFDWLVVGWKYESIGAPKEDLLEETLYTRYFSYLDKTYSDFIMCPRIDKIERINGDTRRHIVHVSALNYSAHHGDIPYDRILLTLTDTPEGGVQINKVAIQKGISGKKEAVYNVDGKTKTC